MLRRLLLLGHCVALIAACAADPAAMRQTLDAKTGSTVNVPAAPMVLFASVYRSTPVAAFAYLGPFDVDRMGMHTLFLWLLVPDELPSTAPLLQCDGKTLDLAVQSNVLEELGISQPPYQPPYSWGRQWYYLLSNDALRCLAQAGAIGVRTASDNAQAEAAQFLAKSVAPAGGFALFKKFAAERNGASASDH